MCLSDVRSMPCIVAFDRMEVPHIGATSRQTEYMGTMLRAAKMKDLLVKHPMGVRFTKPIKPNAEMV